MSQAAEIFAERKARAEFGKRGRVGAIQQNCHSVDQSFAEYDAFIGYASSARETTGRNVRFTVHCS